MVFQTTEISVFGAQSEMKNFRFLFENIQVLEPKKVIDGNNFNKNTCDMNDKEFMWPNVVTVMQPFSFLEMAWLYLPIGAVSLFQGQKNSVLFVGSGPPFDTYCHLLNTRQVTRATHHAKPIQK